MAALPIASASCRVSALTGHDFSVPCHAQSERFLSSFRSTSLCVTSSPPSTSRLLRSFFPSYICKVSVGDPASVAPGTPTGQEDVQFIWKGDGGEILLTGDFLNWDIKVPLQKLPNGTFSATQKLPPGKYMYKFIVDGVWQHSPSFPVISDGAGGFNNIISIEEKKVPEPAPVPKAETAPAEAASPPEPKAAESPAGKKVAGKAAGKKAAAKPIQAAMNEDIIPALVEILSKEEGLTGLQLSFENFTLCGQFIKNEVPYSFWAFFPDGKLEGSRGFSLTSFGNPPSTVEPFIIDERRITPEIVVFWVQKRLFMQKLLALN